MKLVARGAEAVLYLERMDSQTVLVKERVKKGYRLPVLDGRIRQNRTKTEADLIARARRAGVDAPMVLDVKDSKILMEWLGKERLKEKLSGMTKTQRLDAWSRIGRAVSKLHTYGIVHGDLTTSNMVLKDGRLWLIDFGLGRTSKRVEDQAVDLYLLYEAIRAAHFNLLEEGWKVILKTYKQNYSQSQAVFERLEKIKKRRRYM